MYASLIISFGKTSPRGVHPYEGYVLKRAVKDSLPDDNGKNLSPHPLPILHYLLWKLNRTRKNFQTGAISPLSFCVIESIIGPTD